MEPVIFVRERRKVEQGERKPRYRVVGVSGGNTKLYVYHVRKKEIEQIAAAAGAKIVYLDSGKGQHDGKGRAKS